MSYDCSCDYDAPSAYSRTTPRARKRHECCECRGSILPGEQYERVFGVWDGDWSTFVTCARCIDIRTWTKNNVPCLCWCHGQAIEDCRDAVVEAQYRAPDETKGLYFGLLRRLATLKKFNVVHA